MQMAACCKILYLLYLPRKTFTGFSVLLLRECPVALCHGAVGLQGAREGRPTLPCAGHSQFQWPHHGHSWASQQKWWCGRDVRLQSTRRTMGKQAVALQPVEDHSGQVSTEMPPMESSCRSKLPAGALCGFVSHHPSVLLFGNKLNSFPPSWVCFACDGKRYSCFYLNPQAFLSRFLPSCWGGGERLLAGAWQQAKVNQQGKQHKKLDCEKPLYTEGFPWQASFF